MRIKICGLLILLVASLHWNSKVQNSDPPKYRVFNVTLNSGKKIQGSMVMATGWANPDPDERLWIPPGLRFVYLTDVALDDKTDLRKEVDEIWEVFQKDVEDAHLRNAAIEATNRVPVSGRDLLMTFVRSSFVFERRDDGKWHCLEDDKKDK